MGVKSPRQRLTIRCAVILSILVFAGFGASLISLVRIQFVHGEEYRAQAELNQISDRIIPAKRGTIFDSNGRAIAQSASVWKVYINPNSIAELKNEGMREAVIANLSAILHVDAETIRKKTYLKTEYSDIKTKVEFAEKEKIEQLREQSYYKDPTDKDEKGILYSFVIGIKDDEKRYYPYGNFASEVIGFCGAEGGSYGLEQSCDLLLKGTPGRMLCVKNADNDTIPFQLETVHPVKQGANLVLTLDDRIQNYLESGLKQLYESPSGGRGVYGIVMDPNTGAILAMAGIPDYNLNTPDTIADTAIDEQTAAIADVKERTAVRSNARQDQWKNYCTQWSYEPGSVFKTFIASAAVEEKLWSLTETYTCKGSIHIKDRRISCHEAKGHGTQNLSLALVKSCNPFFVTVGQRLGVNTFYKYFEAFGFTEKTGIELDEINSTYHARDKMGPVELASSSFGQSFEVTPIQMITAISAIANGGKLMRPYIIAKQVDEAGNIVAATEPYVRRQVISATTAATVTDMMEQVVIKGSGRNAYVPGYQVAGKTGTSEKLGKEGAYVASFACFAPADNARIAVLMMVDEPQGEANGGGQIVAPVAGEVAANILDYLNVEPKYSSAELSMLNTKAPNLVGKTVAEATAKLSGAGLAYKKIGSGDKVFAQNPVFNRGLPKNGIVVLYTDKGVQAVKTKVPDFKNKSISEVYKLAVEAGINIKVTGSILTISELVSYKQSIEPGIEVDCGSEIIVNFKSRLVTSEAGG